MSKRPFITYFDNQDIQTELRCPYCKGGLLLLQKDMFIKRSKSYEDDLRDYEEDNPPYIYDYLQLASGILECNNLNCKEHVAFIGEVKGGIKTYIDDEVGELDMEEEFLYFSYFNPPLHRITIYPEYPLEIKNILLESFLLSYNHELSCLNKLRILLESLVDTLLYQENIEKKGSLHSRIEKIVKLDKFFSIEESLFAIKHIGNQGSHTNKSLILESIEIAYDILNDILVFIYHTDKNKSKNELIEFINKEKGLF